MESVEPVCGCVPNGILEVALQQVIENKGAPGVDGESWEPLKEDRELRERWLGQLQEELEKKTYRPSPVRRVYILKDNGKRRPLGIPTIRDRVVHTALVLLLVRIFEADFHEQSFSCRPKRRAQQAVATIQKALITGRREVVDADLSGYFDAIPHRELL